MHTVTLKQILDKQPCERGMAKLLKGLNIEIPFNIEGHCLLFKCLTEEELNKPIPLKFILDNNGLKDALWCLKIFKKSKEYDYFKEGMIEIFKLKYEVKYMFFIFKECFWSYTVGNMYAKMVDLLIAEGSDDEDFETQVTELFIKYFCQEKE